MKLKLLIILFFITFFGNSQKKYFFSKTNLNDKTEVEKSISKLSRLISKDYNNVKTNLDSLTNLILIQLVNKKHQDAIDNIAKYRVSLAPNNWGGNKFLHHEIFAKAKVIQIKKKYTFQKSLLQAVENRLINTPSFLQPELNLLNYEKQEIEAFEEEFEENLKLVKSDSIDLTTAIEIINSWVNLDIIKKVNKTFGHKLEKKDNENFIIKKQLIQLKSGVKLNVLVYIEKNQKLKLPVILSSNIYAGTRDIRLAKHAALRGYVGVTLNTRGKRESNDKNEPFEHESEDIYEAIDWIVRQPWCNGDVGMYGGSYLGFSQWSTVKKVHPALKTIVPQVAVGFGAMDYPMENNVFMSYMCRWINFVTNNNLTDKKDFNNYKKWNTIYEKWYKSGQSFRKLDSIAGKKNIIFQRWLDHPSHDNFWQKTTPTDEEFANLKIPILTTTGYYDADQEGATYYFKQHHKFNPKAEHYMIIGPYDHDTAKYYPSNIDIYGNKLDEVAKINITELCYDWFDYILKGKKKPAILKDKINFQVMGTNQWKHVDNITKVNSKFLKFYIDNGSKKSVFEKPINSQIISKEIDFKYRENEYKYNKFGTDSIYSNKNDIIIISEKLENDIFLSGTFEANLNISINKKDVDLVVEISILKPNNEIISLTSTIARASYSENMSKRNLLTPLQKTNIILKNSSFISRKIEKGSKIILDVGVVKNPNYQINYGTGKDVSDESIEDATEPLKIDWYNDSYIEIPILEE